MQQSWLVKNPFHGGDPLICLSDETPRERILTYDEEKRLLQACGERTITYERGGKLIKMRESGENHPHLRALDTACRRGELLKLRWRDVDLQDGLITITARNSKSSRRRLVAITPRLRAELISLWLKSERDVNLPVFGVATTIKTAFASACRAASISGLKFHELRHTATTRLVSAGVAQTHAMKVNGHSQFKTFVRYVNPDAEIVKGAAESLAAFNAQALATALPLQSDTIGTGRAFIRLLPTKRRTQGVDYGRVLANSGQHNNRLQTDAAIAFLLNSFPPVQVNLFARRG